MTKFNVPKEISDKAIQALEIARNTGKIRKGTNETTKTVEKGAAKLVLLAEDVQPQEIVMHIPVLCDEKRSAYVFVHSKEELGRATGIGVPTAAACIVEPGEAKDLVNEVIEKVRVLRKS
ncbi:MAG: 50S ribosomal protein L7Ae [Candidatus Aenigmarchaeota archaeon]|nr:50S ribosomal protein L7Ae [Candidatus Aenigmarchaeota archaeon]